MQEQEGRGKEEMDGWMVRRKGRGEGGSRKERKVDWCTEVQE